MRQRRCSSEQRLPEPRAPDRFPAHSCLADRRHHARPKAPDLRRAVRRSDGMARAGRHVALRPCGEHSPRPCRAQLRNTGMVRNRTAQLCHPGSQRPQRCVAGCVPGHAGFQEGIRLSQRHSRTGRRFQRERGRTIPVRQTGRPLDADARRRRNARRSMKRCSIQWYT